MRRFRPSIASLMALVLLLAIGFAALKQPSELWASSLFTITLASLLTATLGAIARRGQERMAWIGFAVFGWGYLASSFTGSPPRPRLLTAILVENAYLQYQGGILLTASVSPPAGYGHIAVVSIFTGQTFAVRDPVLYQQIAHSVLSLVAGFAGVGFGWALSRHAPRFAGPS